MPRSNNKWTNEFGDRIMLVSTGNTLTSFIASNIEHNKHCHFNSDKAAKIWLNKFRKAKKWVGSFE